MSLIPVALDGDPDTVANWGTRYSNAARNLKAAADELRDLTDGQTFVSLAVEEVRLKALDARAATERVSVRYDGAGAALTIYAHDLRAAQGRANRAIAAFYNSDSTVAQRHKEDLQDQCDADNGQTPDLVERLLEAQRRLNNLVADKAAALAEFHAAEADRDAAAWKAAAAVKEAGDESGLNDNFFEAIAGAYQAAYEWAQEYLAPIIQAIYEALKVISQILSVIALIVTVLAVFIPVLAPLAGVLQAASLVVSLLIVACSLALFLLGKGSLGQLLGDVFSAAVSVFFAAAGPGIRAGMGATEQVASTGARSAGFLSTVVSQAKLVWNTGGTAMMHTNAAAEAITGVTEIIGGEVAGGIGEAIGADNTIDLAPSAAGPDWNAPPTLQVENVSANFTQSYSSVEMVEGPMVQNVEYSASSPLVLTSSGAS
ncbi:MAG: hypothetical protein JWO10_274 [Microbacteriaceae bacterium]|nr:hypothetical protein [Microbacteriaceae bacterium]